MLDREREPPPGLLLGNHLLPPRRRQLVELRPPTLRRRSPLRCHPPTILQPIQRWVERPLIHLQHVTRQLADPLRNPPPVQRRHEETLEDQQVQRSLKKIGAIGHGRRRQGPGTHGAIPRASTIEYDDCCRRSRHGGSHASSLVHSMDDRPLNPNVPWPSPPPPASSPTSRASTWSTRSRRSARRHAPSAAGRSSTPT